MADKALPLSREGIVDNVQTPGGNTTTAGAVEQLAPELKPCPFCAHPTVGMARMDERNWFAECNRCGASMLPATSEAKAITAWNTRSQAHSLPGDVGMLVDQSWLDRRQAEPDADVEAGGLSRAFIAEPARRVIEKIADAVTTMQRECRTALELGNEIAKECVPLFEQLGMSNEGDGWGFDEGDFAALTPSALSGDKDDDAEQCKRCGHNNPSWSAPSPLWNAVIRGGSIDGDALFCDMVCASCFMEIAEQQGIASDWTVKADKVNVPLETTTPSGRVWDDDKGLWVSALSGDAGEVRSCPMDGDPCSNPSCSPGTCFPDSPGRNLPSQQGTE